MGSTARWVSTATLLGLLAATIAVLTAGTDEEGMRVGLRATALVGFPFLVACYAATGLARLWPREATTFLAARRRQLGLAFAGVWAVHLAQIGMFLSLPPDPPLTVGGLLPGISGYLFLTALVAFSVPPVARINPRATRAVLRLGEHWVFAVFTLALVNAGMTVSTLWFLPAGVAAAAYAVRWRGARAPAASPTVPCGSR